MPCELGNRMKHLLSSMMPILACFSVIGMHSEHVQWSAAKTAQSSTYCQECSRYWNKVLSNSIVHLVDDHKAKIVAAYPLKEIVDKYSISRPHFEIVYQTPTLPVTNNNSRERCNDQ